MIIGHQKQWEFLVNLAKIKDIPQSILFAGPEKIGKRTVALHFIKFLNCLNINPKAENPCLSCKNCRDIEKNIFPDVILINPQGKEIKISQIRDLINKMSLHPYSSSFRFAVIDNAHLMNKSAQNAFLKFLEEPSSQSMIFLITSYPDMLLPTIISRLYRLNFFLVPRQEIEKKLIERFKDTKKAAEISFLSFGRPGRAINLFKDDNLNKEKKAILDFLNFYQSDLITRFDYVKGLSNLSPETLEDILDSWLIYLRLIFISQLEREKGDLSKNLFSIIRLENLKNDKFLEKKPEEIVKVIKRIQKIKFLLSNYNLNLKLVFENLLLSF